MVWLEAEDNEGNRCLVNSEHIGKIVMLEYGEEGDEKMWRISAWSRDGEEWFAFCETEVEAKAITEWASLMRLLGRKERKSLLKILLG